MVFKRKARRYAKRMFTKRARSRTSSGISVEKLAIGSAIYGGLRPYAANIIPDVAALNFGGVTSDNLILGVAGYLAAKKGSGMIKTAGQVVLLNEAFIVGAKLSSGMTTSNQGQTTGSW